MSEEVKEEAVQKPKQYLLVVDEMGMTFLSKVMQNITFVEVQGMNMQGTEGYQFLVNPKPTAPIEEPPVPDVVA